MKTGSLNRLVMAGPIQPPGLVRLKLPLDDADPELLREARQRAERLLAREVTVINVRCQPHFPHSGEDAELEECALLEQQHEYALFRRMNCLKKRAVAMLGMVDPQRPNSHLLDEVERLFREADGIRNTLVCVFRKLAVSVARHFAAGSRPIEELVSESYFTLMRAVEIFDCERGTRFSTYLTHAIRRNLLRYVVMSRERQRAETNAGNLEFTPEDTIWNLPRQRRWQRAMQRIELLVDQLGPREQEILRSRFGIGDQTEPQTLKTLAEHYGLSRERIRQLEQRALAKLRRLARQQNLDHPDDV